MRFSKNLNFAFLNLGHFIDHFTMLIFATVAALSLIEDWGMSYAQLIPYATPGFIAFGLFSLPAGWLADKWSREGMMLIFFLGIGISAVLTSLAKSPIQIGVGLFLIGVFGSIYHPVGIPLVIQGYSNTGFRIAINGVFGNMGVASAAMLTGFLIDSNGWKAAFFVPGLIILIVAIGYGILLITRNRNNLSHQKTTHESLDYSSTELRLPRSLFLKVFTVVLITTAFGGLIFQGTTFALPKVFDEKLGPLSMSASSVGTYVFAVLTVASLGQLAVGYLLDHLSIKRVFFWVGVFQFIFFIVMVGKYGLVALFVSIGFMVAVFGQIPVNDVLLGRITSDEWRSRVYGLRFVLGFSVMALTVPLLAWIYSKWSFDILFLCLAAASVFIILSVMALPKVINSKLLPKF